MYNTHIHTHNLLKDHANQWWIVCEYWDIIKYSYTNSQQITTNNLTDNLLSNILKSVLLIDNQTTTSSNPGYPDSDKNTLKIPTSNKQ